MTEKTVVPVGLWALRAAGVVFLAAVLAQTVFAGLFFAGGGVFMDMHGVNAAVVAFAAGFWVVASFLISAPRQIVLVGVIASVLTVAQMVAGYAGVLAVHVSVGVAMIAMGARLVQLAFTYSGRWSG